MKTEISAGGIVVRNQKRVSEVLLIRDMNGAWTFPKGKIEAGESARDAGVREITEETGVSGLEVIAELKPIHYKYKRNGRVDKTVHFFLFITKFNGKLVPQKEEGVSVAQWVELDTVRTLLGYPDTQLALFEEAEMKLKQYLRMHPGL